MPLIPTILVEELRALSDPTSPRFSEFPTAANAPAKWADAFFVYMSTMVVPPVPPSVHVQGRDRMAEQLRGMGKPGAAYLLIPKALLTWAGLIVAGAGQVNFVAIPPPLPLFLSGAPSPNSTIAITAIVTQIDVWLRTGLAGPVPPAVPAIPWS